MSLVRHLARTLHPLATALHQEGASKMSLVYYLVGTLHLLETALHQEGASRMSLVHHLVRTLHLLKKSKLPNIHSSIPGYISRKKIPKITRRVSC